MRRGWLCSCAAGALFLLLPAGPASAQGAQPTSLFGEAGLIDLPSARMAPDAELAVSAAMFHNTQRYSLAFQALPWLSTSFRYSGLSHFDPLYPVYYDRSFGVKVRLWDEGDVWPALAIGTNDLVGTGIFSGEYVVASKQIGPIDLTLGMGWGRLASANTIRNPLTLISKSFETRAANDVGLGGNFSFGRYFHGPNAGLFGGVSWRTPVEGLTLLAEYSSDKYTRESGAGNFRPDNQFNIGASYQLFENVVLGMGWLYGNSVYGSVSFSLDPVTDAFPEKIGPTLPPPSIRSEDEQRRSLQVARDRRDNGAPNASVEEALVDILFRDAQVQDVAVNGQTLTLRVARPSAALCGSLARQIAPFAGDITTLIITGAGSCAVPRRAALRTVAQSDDIPLAPRIQTAGPVTIDATGPSRLSRTQADASIRRKAREQNIALLALALTDNEAIVYYENNYYFAEGDAIDRLMRILMADAPGNVEVFRLIPVAGGTPQAQIEIPRGTAERNFTQQGNFNLFRDQARYRPAPMDNPVLRQAQRGTYPRFTWSVFPQLRQQLFDPNNPFGVQLLLGADAIVDLLPGLRLMTQVEANVANDFDTSRKSDSVLPHVRTDFVEYFAKGKSGIGILQLEENFRLTPNTFVSLRAGYLESMFAGIGGETLWQPEGARWALGGDLYYVRQRKFDRLFGLQSYDQTTGHMTLYYASPWYNLDFQFRIGRYLAGDWGTTAQVSRRFASGLEVGVFATKTNVTAAQFGEGSFDKGIMIRIPLTALLPINTQQEFGLALRPVQRDGGQTLTGDAQLYDRLRRGSESELRRQSLD